MTLLRKNITNSRISAILMIRFSERPRQSLPDRPRRRRQAICFESLSGGSIAAPPARNRARNQGLGNNMRGTDPGNRSCDKRTSAKTIANDPSLLRDAYPHRTGRLQTEMPPPSY